MKKIYFLILIETLGTINIDIYTILFHKYKKYLQREKLNRTTIFWRDMYTLHWLLKLTKIVQRHDYTGKTHIFGIKYKGGIKNSLWSRSL